MKEELVFNKIPFILHRCTIYIIIILRGVWATKREGGGGGETSEVFKTLLKTAWVRRL